MPRSLLTAAAVALCCCLSVHAEEGVSTQDGAWTKPKAPGPKPFMMVRRKIKKVTIKEPSILPPASLFPSPTGQAHANSISFIGTLMNQVQPLVYSKKKLRTGCVACHLDWRRRQMTAMSESPMRLPFRPVNGSSAHHVTLPIERMAKIKTYNRTVFRPYVDEQTWEAPEWFLCGYPGAERFAYHAVDINPLEDGFPPFVQWTTGAIWNETGTIEVKGDEGAGSHVLRTKDDAAAQGEAAHSSVVPALDFAAMLLDTVQPEDHVVVKMDVENAEFRVIDKLFSTGAIELIDEMFIECHGPLTKQAYEVAGIRGWLPEAWVRSVACINIEARLRRAGVYLHEWD